MRDAILPAALLCASLGLALGFAPARIMLWALLLLTTAAIAAILAPIAPTIAEIVFTAAAISTALTAASVYLPRPSLPALPLGLALNAGAWAGALIAVAGKGALPLAWALPAALVALPAAWAITHGYPIVPKIAASWLIAVSVLAATLPIVPTPGYERDHMQ